MAGWLLDGRGIAIPAAATGVIVGVAVGYNPGLALVALVLVIVALLVLFVPEAMLLALIVALPWENYLHYPSETLSMVKLLGGLLLVSFLIRILQRDHRLTMPPTGYAVLAFALLASVSFIVSPDPGAGTGRLLSYYLFGSFFFLIVQFVRDRASLTRMLRCLALSVAAAALAGFVLFLQGRTSRVAGPIGDPNDFGYLMVTVLPLVVYLLATDRRWRPIWVACVPIMLAAMFATLSRGVLVALGAVLLWAIATRRVKAGGLAISAAAIVAVLAAGFLIWGPLIEQRLQQKETVTQANTASREALWQGAVSMWMDHPLTGVGPHRFGAESPNYVQDNPVVLNDPAVHNTYLQILADEGGPAFIAFLAFLTGSWISLARARRRSLTWDDRDGAMLATAVQAGLVAGIVGGIFLSEDAATPLWLLGAFAAVVPVVTAAVQPARRDPQTAPLPLSGLPATTTT